MMRTSDLQIRRKPRQSRAKMTQMALKDSFVRLLQQQSADQISIRAITDLAGVGLGTFYEYFSNKNDLIALTIHLHVKHNAQIMQAHAQQCISSSAIHQLAHYLAQIVDFQISQVKAQQFLWAQTFLLERQISTMHSYRKSYAMMVDMWCQILQHFLNQITELHGLALQLQRICYGFISQSLLIDPQFQQWNKLASEIMHALALEQYICHPATTRL